MLGLTADDFKVRIDGKAARVETATWIGEHDPEIDRELMPSTPSSGGGRPLVRLKPDTTSQPVGRLVVFLFQKDLEAARIVGLMRMLVKSRHLLDTLTASDRIAILSFDSHLTI